MSWRWSRVLVVVGAIAMLIGAIDPLEGSLVILPGCGLVALGARLARSRFAPLLAWAFALTAVGVALLFGLSALGGIGGTTGRPMGWALALLPYPIGWGMGLFGAVRLWRERPSGPVPGAAGVA